MSARIDVLSFFNLKLKGAKKMKKALVLLAAVCLLFSLVERVAAQESNASIVDRAVKDMAQPKVTKLSPEGQRIQEVKRIAGEKIAAIERELAFLGEDRSKEPELQKRAEKIRQDMEIEILKVRLEFAQERKDTARIKEIQTALDRLLNPPKRVAAPPEKQPLSRIISKPKGEDKQ